MRTITVPAAIVAFVLPLALLVEHPVEARQTAQQLEREVRESLRGKGDLRRIEVSVEGAETTLSGRVPTFWAKDQAIKRALDVDGIETVVSELGDSSCRRRQRHRTRHCKGGPAISALHDLGPHHRPRERRQCLPGWTCDARPGQGGTRIFERVAKVKGVQDVQNDIVTLPPSQGDRNLRNAIARGVFSSPHFERFRTMSNPPFHIIVHKQRRHARRVCPGSDRAARDAAYRGAHARSLASREPAGEAQIALKQTVQGGRVGPT